MNADVEAYEKLGAFYLGRPLDAASGATRPEPLLYDSKDLLTHAVCVGMTGSGKTGLCLSLLEEAAIDGIPALLVDVKGDLGNLLLTFPELRGEDFRPWINEDDAQRQGVDADTFAQQQADLWRRGLADWNQDGERIRRLRQAVDIEIYTPGSEAGQSISILSSFKAPPPALRDDNDLLQERIGTTVSSLLGLLGIDADPLRSREHILLANLLDAAWRQGHDLDMAGLIQSIQSPPIQQVGVMPLESFYPSKDRFELAMAINNLLAAPGFKSWTSGQSLDIDPLLYGANGKPRIAIFSIAHLGDAERMFFVSLLLNQTLGWMRGCSGTTSLRALLYMDEVYGYLPPVANPPSKRPLLTLLKQARAFGLGLVLATQNPVDLDYKALSNIGTWFLGRLQTERDKQRVMDGLEGAAEGSLSRRDLERLLSDLGKRVFLLHNVHEDEPVTFKVRWAMSYLRGPLTRQHIQLLRQQQAAPVVVAGPQAASRQAAGVPAAGVPAAGVPAAGVPAAPAVELPPPPPVAGPSSAGRPLLPPNIPQLFLPDRLRRDEPVHYLPALLGAARVHFVDSRKGIETSRPVMHWVPVESSHKIIDWYQAADLDTTLDRLESEPRPGTPTFGTVDEDVVASKALTALRKDFADALYRGQRFQLLKSPTFDEISQPGEDERAFRIRLADEARQQRDQASESLRRKYAKKLQTLEDRIRRAEEKVEKERQQAKSQKLSTVINIGTSLLGALLGRKKISSTNMRRAGSALRGFNRSSKEAQDVDRAEESLETTQQRYQEMEAELKAELEEVTTRFDAQSEVLETIELKPRRTDVDVQQVALLWMPHRQQDGRWVPAWEG